MPKPLLVFDVDGVLADFTYGWRTMAHYAHGYELYSCGGQRAWAFEDMDPEHVDAMWKRVADSKSFWNDLYTLIGYGEILDMRESIRDFEPLYLTHRPGMTASMQTRNWLKNHLFPHGEVINAYDKAKALDVFRGQRAIAAVIEDAPRNISAFLQAGWPIYIRDWPYNRLPEFEGIPRVSSISEFIVEARSEMAELTARSDLKRAA